MNISEVTRHNIIDTLRSEQIQWHGRLEEINFLKRLFNLSVLPSTDSRFRNAEGDIWQHRVNNYDWDDDWVYNYPAFNLIHGADGVFLCFLCEMVHPAVRADSNEVAHLIQLFNDNLAVDGWELVEQTRLSGKPVFAARLRLTDLSANLVKTIAIKLNTDYVSQQITRMNAALESDPDLAIGTAKEFLETICKTILNETGVETDNKKLPQLVRLTQRELKLVREDIPEHAKAADTIRNLLSSLTTISSNIAELRNPYGTGHGRGANFQGLQSRHARLAVNAASALGVFLFETYVEQQTTQ